MSKIMFMIKSIFGAIKQDVVSGYESVTKPREILNMLFFLSILFMFTGKWLELKIVLILYPVIYVWKVIKQGDWRRRMRESIK